MFGIFVPEMEGPIATSRAESAVLWVEGYGIDGVDICSVSSIGRSLAVTFEREI